MANTTDSEKTQAQKDEEQVVVAKSVTKKDVIDGYSKGKNYYDLAEEFFGFRSDEAVNRIRGIVEGEIDQN
jgi:hypothetical protein